MPFATGPVAFGCRSHFGSRAGGHRLPPPSGHPGQAVVGHCRRAPARPAFLGTRPPGCSGTRPSETGSGAGIVAYCHGSFAGVWIVKVLIDPRSDFSSIPGATISVQTAASGRNSAGKSAAANDHAHRTTTLVSNVISAALMHHLAIRSCRKNLLARHGLTERWRRLQRSKSLPTEHWKLQRSRSDWLDGLAGVVNP